MIESDLKVPKKTTIDSREEKYLKPKENDTDKKRNGVKKRDKIRYGTYDPKEFEGTTKNDNHWLKRGTMILTKNSRKMKRTTYDVIDTKKKNTRLSSTEMNDQKRL